MTEHNSIYSDEDKFSFFTDKQREELVTNDRLAQKRTNKLMQISRLSSAVKAIRYKLGYDTKNGIERALCRGDIDEDSTLWDAYLLASFELRAAQKKLAELPKIPKMAVIHYFFYHEVQKEDPDFWKEMKERAGARCAKINQMYCDVERETTC